MPPGGSDAGALPPAPAERVHPGLALEAPAHGAFVAEGPVELRGRTTRGSARIARLLVGDEEAAVGPDGAFAHEILPVAGPHIAVLRVEADDGGRAVDALTVFGGPVHPPGAVLRRALLVHAGPALLDDDDDDLDDVARLIEVMLLDPGFAEALAGAQLGEDGDLTLRSFAVGAASVDLRPGDGCLDATVRLGDDSDGQRLGVDLELEASGWMAALGSQLFIHADQAEIAAALCPELIEGGFQTTVSEAVVELRGLRISTDENPDLAEGLPALHDALKQIVEGMLGSQLEESLGAFVDKFLSTFAIERTFGQTVPVTVRFSVAELAVDRAGLELTLDGSFSAAVGLPVPPPGAGSLRTDDPAPKVALSARPQAVALSDDAANQLLFSSWWGGLTTDFSAAEALGGTDVDLSALPEVFQPLSGAVVDLGLPATLVEAGTPDYHYDLAAGEVAILLLVGADRRFRARLHLRAGVRVALDASGQVVLELDNRPKFLTVAAGVSEVPPGLDPGDVAALLRMMVPSLLGAAKASLPGFPVPAIPLSTFSATVAEFQGTELALKDPAVRKLGEGGGYLVVEGEVERRPVAPAP